MSLSLTYLTTEKPWWSKFFRLLGETGIVSAACKGAGVTRETVYLYRRENLDFAARWAEAEQLGIDMLEDIARKRAMQASDTLMIFLLKHKRPEVFNPPTQSQVQMDVSGLSDDELARRIAALEAGVPAEAGS